MKIAKPLPPIEGVVFMHPDGPHLREFKDGEFTDNVFSLKGSDTMHPELMVDDFYSKELGIEHVMLVIDVRYPPEGGIKFKDVLRLNISQFGDWKTWDEFFELIKKGISIFSDPNVKLVEFDQNPTLPTDNKE